MTVNKTKLNGDDFREAIDDIPSNPLLNEAFDSILEKRYSKRALLQHGSLLSMGLTSGLASLSAFAETNPVADAVGRTFKGVPHGVTTDHMVADGYQAQVLLRWGDKLLAGAEDFSPENQTAESQAKQFGYNNDFIGYIPLPYGSENSDHGLLCINHEYTSEEVMFPGLGRQDDDELALTDRFAKMDENLVNVEMMAHGGSIVEVKKDNNIWTVVDESDYARRITANTPMKISGPAKGHARMKTTVDDLGENVFGTINNCAGGITPWGTYIMAEENFHYYFMGDIKEDDPQAKSYARVGLPGNGYIWSKYHDRFDMNKEPNEANRFGWVVEIDPLDKNSTPVKRTALGRFKHEGSETVINKDGRLVIYMGDDQRFDYVYKFVSDEKVNMQDRAANKDLLDKGTLYVAKFEENGDVNWLALVYGENGLTADNGFASQADVMIDTRLAADFLGATPMDRPEDVTPNPMTGKVYVMLTNNSKRLEDEINAVNSRADNIWGQIVEIIEPEGDFASTLSKWDMLVRCGNPQDEQAGAMWNVETGDSQWFACPDNSVVDKMGRLWISTDQGSNWSTASGNADGLWSLETEGNARGLANMLYRVPIGAELCGPCFTPDAKTAFVAVQHPAVDGAKDFPGFEKNSTYEDPATRWPDFKDNIPPRPSIVVLSKTDGGVI